MLRESCHYEDIMVSQRIIIEDLTRENIALRVALKDAKDPPARTHVCLDDLPPEVADLIKAEAETIGLAPEGIEIIRATFR